MRKLGVRAGDLAVAAVYVDVLARALSKAQLLDSYYSYYTEKGIVRPDGQGEPTLGLYVSLLNQARLTAWKLAEHMARQEGTRGADLDAYIVETYGNGSGSDA